MQLEKKIFCHWDLVRFVSKENLKQEDGTFLTLSVTNGKLEYMMFLGKSDSDSEYEVRIYKSKPNDKYIPNEHDNVKRYEENDEFVTFYFDEYEDAHEFIDWIPYNHCEYKVRPSRPIKNN